MKNKRTLLPIVLRAIGMGFCTIPVLLTIILYFPLWMHADSGRFLSGFSVLLIAISALPIYRYLKKRISDIPSVLLWLMLYLLFLLTSSIIYEMLVISFVGFSGNLLGSLFFYIEGRIGNKDADRQ